MVFPTYPSQSKKFKVECPRKRDVEKFSSSFRFGYVEFEDVSSAEKAKSKCDGTDVGGRNIRVNFAKPRDQSGGGGGGRGGFRGGRGGRGGGRGTPRGRGELNFYRTFLFLCVCYVNSS